MVKKAKEHDLTNPRKKDTIRTSISYRSVPGKRGPECVRSDELQSPLHKSRKDWTMWHGFRILTHTTPNVVRCNPEVSGSLDWLSGQANPLPATNENRIPWGYGF